MGDRNPTDVANMGCADPDGVAGAALDPRGMLEMLVWRDALGRFSPGIYVVVHRCNRCPLLHLASLDHDGGSFPSAIVFAAPIGGPPALGLLSAAGDA